jgi:hypothetical protein
MAIPKLTRAEKAAMKRLGVKPGEIVATEKLDKEMAKRKVKVLKESHVSDAYEVTTGINFPDGDKEKRVEAGAVVFEKDFDPKVWKALNKLNALKQVVEVEPLKEGESIEVIS